MSRLLEMMRSISGCISFRRTAQFSVAAQRALLPTLFAAVALCVSDVALQAAQINYGDFMGSTVTYQMVREDSNSGDSTPLFGAPSVFADTLDFDPVGFNAHASGASGIDVTDGNLAFMVKAKPSNGISNILIKELGDTTLSGFGTDATFTAVTMHGILNISEVGFIGINSVSIPISITNFAPSGGTFGLATDFGGGPGSTLGWSGSTLIDLTTANPLVAAAYAAQKLNLALPITKISVNFDNTLMALSEAGTTSVIAKKDNGVTITTNTPEPTSCVLALLGVMLAAVGARRSR